VRIVALDGGGIRGLVSATLIAALEERVGPLHARADRLAGSSVGAIVACGLSLGLSGPEVAQAIHGLAGPVFAGSWRKSLRLRWRYGPSAPAHDGDDLARALRKILGDRTLRGLPIPVEITTYDAARERYWILASDDPVTGRLPAWQACLASAAAPTYFPAVRVDLGPDPAACLDGGVGCNSPAALAVARATWRGAPLPEIRCVAVGTGYAQRPLSMDDAEDRGRAEWALDIIPTILRASTEAWQVQAAFLLGGRLARLDVELPPDRMDLDRVDAEHLERLELIARKGIDGEAMARAAALL